MPRRRYRASQVRRGEVKLPRSLAYITNETFYAVAEEVVAGKKTWFVELLPKRFKSLLESQALREVSDAERREYDEAIREQLDKVKRLENKVNELIHEKEALIRQHNEFVQTVVNEDGQVRVPKSPKNYLAVAEERGTRFGSPPLQGGDAGLEKK